jgi:hypothetical protein
MDMSDEEGGVGKLEDLERTVKRPPRTTNATSAATPRAA